MDGQMVRFGEEEGEARSGYLVVPAGGTGPGVLVLHAWWGLNDFIKLLCNRLAAEGYVAFAPDLLGKVVDTIDEAARLVQTSEEPGTQNAALRALRFLESQPGVRPTAGAGARAGTGGGRVGVIGFSFGAAYALLLSTLRPDAVAAVVVFYGTYIPDFSGAKAAYLGHFSPQDEYEPREGIEALQAALSEAGRPVSFYFYPGTTHWFMEEDRPDAYRAEAASLAWQRTLAFLGEQLGDRHE